MLDSFGDLVYFSVTSPDRVLAVDNNHLFGLKFLDKTAVDFSLSAVFRFEPYFGRFPESKEAKEKVIKAQYGKPLKPGSKVSVRHLLTSTYISKAAREKDGAFRACLQKEKSDESEVTRLPDMCLTVVSSEAWKDEGVLDGSKVQISISESAHTYLLDADTNPFSGTEAVFRFSQQDPHTISVHSFLHWRDCNEQSAKYGFVCQLKTNHGMFLAARPNLQSSACLHFLKMPQALGVARVQQYNEETVLPEYWGEIPVDLTTDEADGNSYWTLEQANDGSSEFAHFQGGIVCGGQHFRLKHVLSRRYLGPGFVLSSRDSAQVLTFPYSGENSPERILERLNGNSPREAEKEAEDIVEMFEQYPLLKVGDESTSVCLVGQRFQPTAGDVWGKLMQPFAWRLMPDSAVRQTLTFISECTPDKLLKFEVRETDTRAAAKMLEIALKMEKFVEFHKSIEDPERYQLADETEAGRRTSTSLTSFHLSEIRLQTESDEGEEEETGMGGLGESRAAQSLHAGQFYELQVLKSLLSRVSKVKELKLLIDAQITSEILRLVVFVMSGESRIDPEVKAIIEASFKDFLFKSKLVWSRLYSSGCLLNFLALNYTQQFLLVLETTKEYQLPQRFEGVLIATAISQISPAFAQLIDADRRIVPPHDNERTITELMTTHFSEIDSETFAVRFPDIIRQFALTDSEMIKEVEKWKDMKSCYQDLEESAARVDWLTALIDKREASSSMIQKLLPPILELFNFLVLVTYPEADGGKGATSQISTSERETQFDQDNVKQFVQSAFKLIQTFQYWIDFHAVRYYYDNRSIQYADLEEHIRKKLTLGSLDSTCTLSFARVLGIVPKPDLEKPLLSDHSDGQKPSEADKAKITIADLLAKIAKCTRYRVQEHPSLLLKMIDKALNPAQSAAVYIEKLCLKENFKELFRKVKSIRENARFFAETTTTVSDCFISADLRDNFKQYVRALQDLLSSLERVSPESRKSAQEGLVCAGFGTELRRLWNYVAMLSDQEECAEEMRGVTYALSRYYATDNPKLMKEVFRLLSERTFNLSHPEYLKLLFEMNVLPRDDEVLKLLISAIIATSRCSATAAIHAIKQSFCLSDVGLRALLPFGADEFIHSQSSDSLNRKVISAHLVQFAAALIERNISRHQFVYTRRIRASIAQLFSPQERQAHLLSAMLKNVYLTDNLVKKYLQAWRYLILSHHAVLRMSVAVGAIVSVPGLPQTEKVGKRGEERKGKRLTVMQVMDSPNPALREIVSSFTPHEKELLSSCDFDIFSKKDIRDFQKQWQGKMQSLMERIIDYVCRSSNTSIQKEELQVLAEIVKDDPVAKRQVIEVLGRYRQYRYFFGLCRTAVARKGLTGVKDVEKKEALGLVSAFLNFFQAACDGCFAPFQNYMREQNEDQKDNVNLIDILARKLEDLIVDSSKLDAEDTELASELAVTLLEAVSGPCSANIQEVCRYPRLLRGIALFVSRAVVAPEVQSKLDTVMRKERKKKKSIGGMNSLAVISGLSDYIKRRFPPQQQQTVFSDPRLMVIMGKMYVKERKKELNTSAEAYGLRYPGVDPLKLSLCLQLVNLMIALLEGNERRPEKIAELMPSVNFTKFEKVSQRLVAGVDEEFFRRFETGLFELEPKEAVSSKRDFASPGVVMNFAMRCFILYYTSIPEDDIPESRSRLLKYIGSVEIEQPGADPSRPEIHSVIFQVPFKALHLSWLDTENLLAGLSSNSREENLKTFVGQLDTYLGEMKFLQKLSQSRPQNYLRQHWKHTFWVSYAALAAVNVAILFAFDDFEQIGYEVDSPYWILITLLGLAHSCARLVWTISYYVRFWHLIWFPLTGFEATNHLSTLAHHDKPGTVKAFFDMDLSQSLLNVRTKGVLMMGLNFSLIPLSLIALWHPWVFPFLLLEVCSMESTLQNIIKAITNRFRQLVVTFAFAVLLMCVYAVLAFFWQEPCTDSHSLLDYVFSSVYFGMRDDKGIGEVMGEQPQSQAFRFFFDMSFFILITTVLMAIVFGIVVDTFGELRDEMNEAERNMTSTCSICRQPRSSIEIRGEGWDKHCLLTHNPFAYLYFMAYVKEKDINDCSGVEKFVRQQLDHKDIGFFPTTFRERGDYHPDA